MADRGGMLLENAARAASPPLLAHETDPAALQKLYEEIPIRLPALYEALILGFRWEAESTLGEFELLANPPEDAFPHGLLSAMRYDPHLAKALWPAALIPFARPAGGDYDPICFNGAVRTAGRDDDSRGEGACQEPSI